jgi:hypothetical protein
MKSVGAGKVSEKVKVRFPHGEAHAEAEPARTSAKVAADSLHGHPRRAGGLCLGSHGLDILATIPTKASTITSGRNPTAPAVSVEPRCGVPHQGPIGITLHTDGGRDGPRLPGYRGR